MPKIQKWSTVINETSYQITLTPNQWSGNHRLTVNGKEMVLPRKPFQAFTGLDTPIRLGEKEAHFVLIGSKSDIAIDGIFLRSGKPYMPLKGLPWWIWMFVIAFAAIPVITLGGALPAVIAVIGAMWCVRIAILPTLNTGLKIFICFAVTASAWGLTWLLIFEQISS
jgi:hypothetical protein